MEPSTQVRQALGMISEEPAEGFLLGERVRDKITGLEGVVIGRTAWFTGCTTYGVQPSGLHDGKPLDPQWLDGIRLVPAPGEVGPVRAPSDNGGPSPTPGRQVKGA